MSNISEDIGWYKRRNYITQIDVPKKITDKDTLLKYVTHPTIASDVIDHIDAGGALYDNISTYLTFTALEEGEFGFSKSGLSYSIDNGLTWTELNVGETISVSTGDEILWKATTPLTGTTDSIGTFTSTGTYDVRGNILSLLFGDDFASKDSLEGYTKCFFELFLESKVVHAHNLALRANTLSDECYHKMFHKSTSLISAPELPAMNLTTRCYRMMFNGCTSLKDIPNLPATIMKFACYYGIFGATATEKCVPLPATTLATWCYGSMYTGCPNITTAPELPATKLAENCYNEMFSGSSLKYPPKLPATELTSHCYTSMFHSSQVLYAPELPATELAESCYSWMFYNCPNITSVAELDLPATELADYCYYGMFLNCSSLTEVQKVLPARTSQADDIYRSMYENTAITEAPEIMLEGEIGYQACRHMFAGCKNLTKAPVLKASKLTSQSYFSMFSGCSKLNYIKALFTEFESNSLLNWVSGVSATGTFIKNPNMTTLSTGVAGIPSGWTVYDDGSEPDESIVVDDEQESDTQSADDPQ